MSKIILAVDPGLTTGVAYKLENKFFTNVVVNKNIEDIPYNVWELIGPDIDTVIFENFQAQIISKYGLYTVRIIGGIYALCKYHNINIVRQLNTFRQPYIKPASWYIKQTKGSSHMDHENDALAHLFAYLHAQHDPIINTILSDYRKK